MMGVSETRRRVQCRDCLLMSSESHGKVYWYRCPLHGNRRVGCNKNACRDVVIDFLADKIIGDMLSEAKRRPATALVLRRAVELVASHRRRDAWLLLNADRERSRTMFYVTTRRQSDRLVSAGMDISTAGMYYDGDSALIVPDTGIPESGVPCWTYREMVSAMMSMPEYVGCSFVMDSADGGYRAVCESPDGTKAEGFSYLSLTDAVFELLLLLLKNGKRK